MSKRKCSEVYNVGLYNTHPGINVLMVENDIKNPMLESNQNQCFDQKCLTSFFRNKFLDYIKFEPISSYCLLMCTETLKILHLTKDP